MANLGLVGSADGMMELIAVEFLREEGKHSLMRRLKRPSSTFSPYSGDPGESQEAQVNPEPESPQLDDEPANTDMIGSQPSDPQTGQWAGSSLLEKGLKRTNCSPHSAHWYS